MSYRFQGCRLQVSQPSTFNLEPSTVNGFVLKVVPWLEPRLRKWTVTRQVVATLLLSGAPSWPSSRVTGALGIARPRRAHNVGLLTGFLLGLIWVSLRIGHVCTSPSADHGRGRAALCGRDPCFCCLPFIWLSESCSSPSQRATSWWGRRCAWSAMASWASPSRAWRPGCLPWQGLANCAWPSRQPAVVQSTLARGRPGRPETLTHAA